MTIRVLVNGAHGKMGQLTVATLSREPGIQLVGEANHKDHLAEKINETKPNVVVDFTNADSVFDNTKTIIECGVHPVIGTSGMLQDQLKLLESLCAEKKLGGLVVPNFSLGAVLMMKYAEEIARYFPEVEILEMHHNAKLDSPSGTALRTADMIAKNRATSTQAPLTTRETIKGARGASHHNIPIHAIRLPGFIASQQVIFGGLGETLTLSHHSINRECFMPGVILACKKVVSLTKLVCGLENVL